MRLYLFFVVLIGGFALTITAAYKPDAFAQVLEKAKTPINKYREYQEEKNEKELGEMYQQEKALWMLKHPLPKDCASPSTNLRAVECKNMRELELVEFRKVWKDSH